MAPFASSRSAVVSGIAETGNRRRAGEGQSTASILRDALAAALRDAELEPRDVDGLVVSSQSLAPDRAGDLAWRLGLTTRFLVDNAPTAAAPIASLALATRAIEAGDASTVVIVGGDAPDPSERSAFAAGYNRARHPSRVPWGYGSPNPLFAMLTKRQMRALGLEREDYGNLVRAQRSWAALNPAAMHRDPLSREDYLGAPVVADPLGRFDCPPGAIGASAYVVTTADRMPAGRRRIGIRTILQRYNDDQQLGDGLSTGLSAIADELWRRSGVTPADVDVTSLYDDYPAVVIAQSLDLGFTTPGEVRSFLRDRVLTHDFPLNTSGGLLSAGQAGGAGGLLGTIEVVRQLQGRAGDRQVAGADLGVVAQYGQVVYRYGSASTIAVLEGE